MNGVTHVGITGLQVNVFRIVSVTVPLMVRGLGGA
jgi:hypothetical protein